MCLVATEPKSKSHVPCNWNHRWLSVVMWILGTHARSSIKPTSMLSYHIMTSCLLMYVCIYSNLGALQVLLPNFLFAFNSLLLFFLKESLGLERDWVFIVLSHLCNNNDSVFLSINSNAKTFALIISFNTQVNYCGRLGH